MVTLGDARLGRLVEVAGSGRRGPRPRSSSASRCAGPWPSVTQHHPPGVAPATGARRRAPGRCRRGRPPPGCASMNAWPLRRVHAPRAGSAGGRRRTAHIRRFRVCPNGAIVHQGRPRPSAAARDLSDRRNAAAPRSIGASPPAAAFTQDASRNSWLVRTRSAARARIRSGSQASTQAARRHVVEQQLHPLGASTGRERLHALHGDAVGQLAEHVGQPGVLGGELLGPLPDRRGSAAAPGTAAPTARRRPPPGCAGRRP